MQRQLRLRRSADYTRLRHKGRAYRHPWMMVSLLSNQIELNRYGFVVAKRLGNAVVRNRTRRVLKEILRLLHPQLQQGFDIVVIARPGISSQSFQSIEKAIQDLLGQADLIVKDSAS